MAPSDKDARERGRDRDKPLYMISVAAQLTGMHPHIERLNLISKLTDQGINLAGVVRILDMRERMLEREAELDDLRARVRELEDEVHEYRMQEKITALARNDASASPEQVMRRLLLGGSSDEKDGE